MKIHTGDIEVAVARLINYRTHEIVPNVSWGLGLIHECDMLVLDKQGRFTEIEIKISMADLKKDFAKEHGHISEIISRLVYAFPIEMLEKALPLIPKECGIIVVTKRSESLYLKEGYVAKWHRMCKYNPNKKKPSQSVIDNFRRLGLMRIWSLKEHNNKKKNK